MGIKRIGGGMAVNQITEGVIWKQILIASIGFFYKKVFQFIFI